MKPIIHSTPWHALVSALLLGMLLVPSSATADRPDLRSAPSRTGESFGSDAHVRLSPSTTLVASVVAAIAEADPSGAPRYRSLASTVDTVLTEDFKLLASDGSDGDTFGNRVSLSGNRALVGASHHREVGGFSGSAYVFAFDGTSWIEEAKLAASDASPGDLFGFSVSLSGDRALIGAVGINFAGGCGESAYIFEFDGVSWEETAKFIASDTVCGDDFGWSVSLSGDRALVGASGYDDAGPNYGAAYIFAFDGTSWIEEAKLLASDGRPGDRFGNSVSLSGTRALVSAPLDGNADVGPNHGSAYVFAFDGTSWIEEAKLTASDAAAYDIFGGRVSLSAGASYPGGRALVGAENGDAGAPDSGSAYIFVFDGTTWTEEAKLTASDASAFDNFGRSVSLSGGRALVGATSDGPGSAYVFVFDGTSWIEEAKLRASDAAGGDFFGSSVSLLGNRALVGALHDDDAGESSGSAYIFDLPASTELTVTCAPVSPPIVIPAGGGGFAYDVEITNNGASSETFDIWIDIVGPGVSRTLGPATRTLAAGAQRSHTPNQNVPGSVPTGAYTHTCNVGAFPVADASAGFDWEKSAAMAPGEPNVIDWTTEAEFVAALGAHTSPDGRRPTSFSLQPAYPNPFNPSTTIRFSLPERAYVELKVFDRLGREVARLVDGTIEAGRHEVLFNAPALPSGVYFARFSAGGFAQTQRLTLLK